MSNKVERLMAANLALRAAELEQTLATCHERVPCPKCRAPVGHRCRRMPRGFSAACGRRGLEQPSSVVGPHIERWSQVVAPR